MAYYCVKSDFFSFDQPGRQYLHHFYAKLFQLDQKLLSPIGISLLTQNVWAYFTSFEWAANTQLNWASIKIRLLTLSISCWTRQSKISSIWISTNAVIFWLSSPSLKLATGSIIPSMNKSYSNVACKISLTPTRKSIQFSISLLFSSTCCKCPKEEHIRNCLYSHASRYRNWPNTIIWLWS